jgi:hypothetical protein
MKNQFNQFLADDEAETPTGAMDAESVNRHPSSPDRVNAVIVPDQKRGQVCTMTAGKDRHSFTIMNNEIQTIEKQANPFAGAVVTRETQNATADTEQSRAIAEVQSAMVIAKRFPRDQKAAYDAIMNACDRPTLAEGALYSYSRGGTDITGPSIRLAEALAQNWGNIQFGIRELEQRGAESTVEAFAWDVETNTRQVKTFQVKHERHTKQGSKKLTDPRDVYELVANQGARRLRACILGVIPGDITEAAVKRCESTLKASADTSPEAMKKMLDAFAPFGVTKEMIEKKIQRRIDSIQPAQVVALKKIYASLRDGMSAPADWFDVPKELPKNTEPAVDRFEEGAAK